MINRTARKISLGIRIEGTPLSLPQFNDLVSGGSSLTLPSGDALREKLSKSVDVVNDALIDNQVVYGITTGFGGMSNTRIDCQSAAALQTNLLTFLAASAGPEIDSRHTLGACLLYTSDAADE